MSSVGHGRGQAVVAHATTSNLSMFSVITELTQDQWKTLHQLLAKKSSGGNGDKLSGKKDLGDVIIDSGASHHMTGNFDLLRDITSIPPCAVGFAYGSRTMGTSMGVFPLSENVSLKNVLFVPSLNCTLISDAKILKQTKCVALFTDTLCVLQDHFSRMLIGTSEKHDGVYYFTEVDSAKIHCVNVSCDQALWHQRLGHPSFSVLSTLPFISSSSTSASSQSCVVCFRAKQTREVFSDSSNKTDECFSLIHCDFWGPYRVHSSCGAVYFLTIVYDFSRAV